MRHDSLARDRKAKINGYDWQSKDKTKVKVQRGDLGNMRVSSGTLHFVVFQGKHRKVFNTCSEAQRIKKSNGERHDASAAGSIRRKGRRPGTQGDCIITVSAVKRTTGRQRVDSKISLVARGIVFQY